MLIPDSVSFPWEQLILVAGHRRGGTTWLGAILGEASELHYIFEPFTVHRHPSTSWTDNVRAYNQIEKWFLSTDQSDERFAQYRTALCAHLSALTSHYWGEEEIGTLLIKLPETERLAWLIPALGVDKVIYIKRHPLGIVNSYDKSNLYRGWDVGRKWDLLLRDAKVHFPEFIPWLEASGTSEVRRIAAMAHLRYSLLDRILGDMESYLLNYEELAINFLEEAKKIYKWLGCKWSYRIEKQLRPYFSPDEPGSGFLAVEKRSNQRAYAWRHELGPWQIHRVRDYFQKLGLTYPMPGAGLPSLTLKEKSAGALEYIQRRTQRGYHRVRGIGGHLKRALLNKERVEI